MLSHFQPFIQLNSKHAIQQFSNMGALKPVSSLDIQFIYIYTREGESVNRSLMDMKLKTCDTMEKNIYWHIFHQHVYTCSIAFPVYWNPQHWSLLTVVSAPSAPPFQPLHHQWNVCHKGGFFSWPNGWKSLRTKSRL
jgi:hypothetical protein